MVPPSRAARSARLASPLRRPVSLIPVPLSRTSQDEFRAGLDGHLDLAGAGVPGCVRQRLAQRAEQVLSGIGGHAHRAGRPSAARARSPASRWPRPTTSRIWRGDSASSAAGRECSEKMADRISLMVSSRASTALLTRRPFVRLAHPRGHALQGHAGGVQPLDDQVVQVAGDPVPVLEHGEALLRPGGARPARGRCPACAAKLISISTAGGASGIEPGRRPAVRIPRTLPGAPSGTTTAGPRCRCSARPEPPARRR